MRKNVNILKLIGTVMLMVALGSQATSARTQQATPTPQSTAQSAPRYLRYIRRGRGTTRRDFEWPLALKSASM